ncbi:MAG TPA: hypothetical protein P5077_14295 [bacterium]|nr:hypothetical protein [bacterium]
MYRIFIVSLFALIALIAVSCGDESTDKVPQNDDFAVADDMLEAPDESVDTAPAVDTLPVQDDIVVDDTPIVDNEPVDDTVVPDESPFETIGDFALNFNGTVNVNLSDYMAITGGKGVVNFNFKGAPYSYGELKILGIKQLFPIAILQQGNVAVMWLESAPGLGAETKKVFAITFPSTIQPGQYVMETAQAYAFYGDININLQGGQFEIKCVRAAGYQGNMTVNSYTGTAVDFLANGLLVDPAAAASQLPYPVCVD